MRPATVSPRPSYVVGHPTNPTTRSLGRIRAEADLSPEEVAAVRRLRVGESIRLVGLLVTRRA